MQNLILSMVFKKNAIFSLTYTGYSDPTYIYNVMPSSHDVLISFQSMEDFDTLHSVKNVQKLQDFKKCK